MVVVLVTLNHFAVIVTDVLDVTALVATLKVELAVLALITTSAGTVATDVLLLESWTDAPCGIGPVNLTVPVPDVPPVIVDGVTDTDVSELPPGWAGLTDRLAWRGTFWIAAVSCTIVGGAEALVVILNVADIAPAGTTTVCGTDATFGSALNSLAVVGFGSGKASPTVPVEDAPPETMDGSTESDEMIPSARALAGSSRRSATSQKAERRHMVPPIRRLRPAP